MTKMNAIHTKILSMMLPAMDYGNTNALSKAFLLKLRNMKKSQFFENLVARSFLIYTNMLTV